MTDESSPPLRCTDCRKGLHTWQVSSFTTRTYDRTARLYRLVCTCMDCPSRCGTYLAFVDPRPIAGLFVLPVTHWAAGVLAKAERVPEQRPEDPSTKKLPVIAMPKRVPRQPSSPAVVDDTRPGLDIMQRLLDGLRRLP